jgi:hypothetical protein
MKRADALARIHKNLPKIKAQAAPFVTSMEDRWEDEELHIAVLALGQHFAGRVNVLDEAVHIEVQMPAVLGFFRKQLKTRITRHAPKLIAKG